MATITTSASNSATASASQSTISANISSTSSSSSSQNNSPNSNLNDTDNNLEEIREFVRIGRTGRRNAMPDVLDPNINVSTSSLSDLMCKIDCGSKNNDV
jgi:hypothetical protein